MFLPRKSFDFLRWSLLGPRVEVLSEQPKNSHCLCIMTQAWPADPHCPWPLHTKENDPDAQAWSNGIIFHDIPKQMVHVIPQVHYFNPTLAGLTPLN